MERKTIIGLIIFLAVLAGVYLFLTGLQRPAPVPEIIIPEVEVVPEAVSEEEEATAPEVREIAVSGTEFNFSPSSITLTEGERVRVVFTNIGSIPHDFGIEGLEVRTRIIGSGQTDSVEFTTPPAGTYIFYCSVAGHRTAGMEGDLGVE